MNEEGTPRPTGPETPPRHQAETQRAQLDQLGPKERRALFTGAMSMEQAMTTAATQRQTAMTREQERQEQQERTDRATERTQRFRQPNPLGANEAARYERELTQRDKTIDGLNEEVEGRRQQSEIDTTTIQRQRAQIGELNTQLEGAVNRLFQAREQIRELERQNGDTSRLQADLQNAQQRIRELELQGGEGDPEEVARLQRQLNQTNEKNNSLTRENIELERRNSALRRENELLRARETGGGAEQVKDPYKLLGVERGSSREEIRRAYRELQQIFHSDKAEAMMHGYGIRQGTPQYAALKALLDQRAKEINHAFDVISGGWKNGETH